MIYVSDLARVMVSVALVGTVAPAPASGPATREVRHVALASADGTTIRFEGRITASAVADIEAALSPATRRIIVNSPGGRIADGIRLGRLVRARRLEIVVDGACISACAQYVFAPAPSKRVMDASVVAFHGTATSRWKALIRAGRPDLAAAYEALAKEEAAFFEEAGLSSELLELPGNEVQPVCYKENEAVDLHSEVRAGIVSRFSLFIPSRKSLAEMGAGQISGFWPEDQQGLSKALSRLPRGVNASFKVERPNPPPGKPPRPERPPLKPCPSNLKINW